MKNKYEKYRIKECIYTHYLHHDVSVSGLFLSLADLSVVGLICGAGLKFPFITAEIPGRGTSSLICAFQRAPLAMLAGGKPVGDHALVVALVGDSIVSWR